MNYIKKRRLFTPGQPSSGEAYFDGFLNPMHHRKESLSLSSYAKGFAGGVPDPE
jgi:hypothetical protein